MIIVFVFPFCLGNTIVGEVSSQESLEDISEPEKYSYYTYDVATQTETYVEETYENSTSAQTQINSVEVYSPYYNSGHLLDVNDWLLDTNLLVNGLGGDIASPTAIVGQDDRVRITDTTVGPYCNTVKIIANWPDGSSTSGSGFVIGPNAVATCGHVIFNNRGVNGEWTWASSATIIPACNGSLSPYGTTYAIAYEIGGEWGSEHNYKDDWGIIKMNDRLGSQTGWLGLVKTDDFWYSYRGEDIINTGYPGYVEDSNGNVIQNGYSRYMYKAEGTIRSSGTRYLRGDWDATGGNSGGPVFKWVDGAGYCAIGILQGGSNAQNQSYSDSNSGAVRIHEWLYDKFITYRNL